MRRPDRTSADRGAHAPAAWIAPMGILAERDLLDDLQALLRERLVSPTPVAGDPGATCDPGIESPPSGG